MQLFLHHFDDLLLWLIHLWLFLVVLPGLLDALGLGLEYVLQQFDEHDFFLHLFLHHLAHICIFSNIYAAPVFVALQFEQHAFESGELHVDVLVAVDVGAEGSVSLAESAVALYQLDYVLPGVAQCLADALCRHFLFLCLVVL